MKTARITLALLLLLVHSALAQSDNWKLVRAKTEARLRELAAGTSGALGGVSTEWASVYFQPRPYIVVVMENYGLKQEGRDAMKEISRTLYDYFWRLGNATRKGT